MKGQQQHLTASFDYYPDSNAAKINLYKNEYMEGNFWKGSFISQWRYGKMDLTLELRNLSNKPKNLDKEIVGQEEH